MDSELMGNDTYQVKPPLHVVFSEPEEGYDEGETKGVKRPITTIQSKVYRNDSARLGTYMISMGAMAPGHNLPPEKIKKMMHQIRESLASWIHRSYTYAIAKQMGELNVESPADTGP